VGHLLGEDDGSGALIDETVWLNDIPVGTLRPSGAAVAITYVHTDQPNTPQQVTRRPAGRNRTTPGLVRLREDRLKPHLVSSDLHVGRRCVSNLTADGSNPGTQCRMADRVCACTPANATRQPARRRKTRPVNMPASNLLHPATVLQETWISDS
jgi:hypothetical protein